MIYFGNMLKHNIWHVKAPSFDAIETAAPPPTSTGAISDTGPATSVPLAGQPGDLAMDILAAYCGHDATPGKDQIERWDQLWSTWDWSRRATTSSELLSGSSVTMSYTFGSCNYGHVAAIFSSACARNAS
jgi:hypothetical protein